MKSILLLIFVLSAACTQTDCYPVSGAPVAPDDPVKSLDAGDCTVPGMT